MTAPSETGTCILSYATKTPSPLSFSSSWIHRIAAIIHRPPATVGDLFEKGNTYLVIVSCGGEGQARPAPRETALAEHDPFLGSAMVFPAYDAIRDQARLMRLTRETEPSHPAEQNYSSVVGDPESSRKADARSRALLSFSNSVTCKRRTSN